MVLSNVPQDAEDSQALLAQGRRLLDEATLEARCAITSNGNGFVDCVGGFVRDINTGLPTSQTCAHACGNDASGNGGLCCIGLEACDNFTGKGE